MDTVVLGKMNAVIVDAATGNNLNIAVFTNVKIVIDEILYAAVVNDNRNMQNL